MTAIITLLGNPAIIMALPGIKAIEESNENEGEYTVRFYQHGTFRVKERLIDNEMKISQVAKIEISDWG
jgi:hypothetical protein